MEDSTPYRKTHLPYQDLNPVLQPNPMRPPRGKSCAHFLFKVLFVALVIIVIPLFPSQAPEFVNESIINKFWELLHLLFIGIAVSYGLFSRRNVEMGIETQSKIENLQHDMSRMFQVSSAYEDGYENPYGFSEKIVIQGWNNAQYYHLGESRTMFSDENSTVVDEQCNPNFSVSENGVENSYGFGEENLVQAWNSQYFQGESMVVMAQPNYGVGEWGEAGSTDDYKPLGLPVRSLKSRVRKRENPEPVNGYESGSGSQGSSESSVKGQNENFGELGSQILEDEFNEAVASPSPIPWHSRSGRREMREKPSRISRPSHFRPLSVDETQFESFTKLRTPSLRSTASFSSHASSKCSSPGNGSPSHSLSSEEMSSKMEDEGSKAKSFQGSSASSGSLSPPKPMKPDVRKAKSYQGSSGSGSPSPPKPMDDEASEVMRSKMENEVGKTKSFQGYSASGSLSTPKPMKPNVRKAKSYQGSSGSGSPSPPKPMDDEAFEVMNSKMENEGSKTKSFQGYSASSGSLSTPKPMKPVVRKAKSYQGSSGSSCPSPPKPMDDEASEVMSSKMEDEGSNTKNFQGSSASSGLPSLPKLLKLNVRKAKSYQGASGSDSPSPPKPMDDKASKVMNSKMEDESSKTNGFPGFPISSGLPIAPKPMKLDARKTKSYQGSSASDLPSPPEPMNDKASSSRFQRRGYSFGSLDENDLKECKNYLKELNECRREDLLNSKESDSSSLKSEWKAAASPTRASLKGKSVRTIRARGLTTKASENGDKAEKMYDDAEMAYMRKYSVRNEGVDSLVVGSSKPNLDNPCGMTKHTVSEHQKRETQELPDNVSAESEVEEEYETQKCRVNSGEDADSESVNGATPDSNEVDKKAGEFIAKFREQIRLQKLASIDRSRGVRLGSKLF